MNVAGRLRPCCQITGQRLHVCVTQFKRRICHGGDTGPDAFARFEIAQCFQQDVFALAGQARRGAEAIQIICMT